MRLLRFLTCAFAALMMLVGCDELGNLFPGMGIGLELSETELTFNAEGGSETIRLTAPVNWKAECDATWITVSPDSGEISEEEVEVTIKVDRNDGEEREADVKFSVGSLSAVTLKVSQEAAEKGGEGEEGGDKPEDPGEDEPELQEVKISELVDVIDSTKVLVKGDIVATYARGFVLSDGTGNVLVYEGPVSSGRQVGSSVEVTSLKVTYRNLPELTIIDNIEVVGQKEITHPEPVVCTAENIAQVKDMPTVYYEVTGVLTDNNPHFFVEMEGADIMNRVEFPKEDLYDELLPLLGATVRISGYYLGYKEYDTGLRTMGCAVTGYEVIELPETMGTLAEAVGKIQGGALEYEMVLNDAVVTCVLGNTALIEDATAGIMLYQAGHGLEAGDKINGKVFGTSKMYNGIPEFTSINLESANVTAGAEIPCTELTIVQLLENYDRYVNCRVLVRDLTITDGVNSVDRNGTVSQAGSEMNLYSQNSAMMSITAGSTGDLTCYPSYYKTSRQLNIYYQEDFHVISSGAEETAKEYAVSEIAGLETGTRVIVKGQVVAKYSSGFMLSDETGNVLVYEGTSPSDYSVGTMVTVNAYRSTYAGQAQLSNVESVVSAGEAAVNYPDPTVCTADNIASVLTNPTPSYVRYTGNLEVWTSTSDTGETSYVYRIAIEGTDIKGAIQYPLADMYDKLANWNDKTVVVTGYHIGLRTSTNTTTGVQIQYLNTLAVDVQTVEPEQPVLPETEGNGTIDSPYTVVDALKLIAEGCYDNTVEVYVTGIVSEVKEVSVQYGNATYWISADGAQTDELYVYRGKYLNGEKFTEEGQLVVGDKVVLLGKLDNYKGNSPQISTNSSIITLER